MTIYGVDVLGPEGLRHPFADLANSPEEWRVIFTKSLQSIRTFLAIHDNFEVLAKCVNQVMAQAASKKENPRWAQGDYQPFMLTEPAELEVVQALALMQTSPRKGIPPSPRSMGRFLPEIPKCTHAFLEMQPFRNSDDPEHNHLIQKIRMHTMLHRNLFVKEDCEAVVQSIFRIIDGHSVAELGFAFSDMFAALIALNAKIEQRWHEYFRRSSAGRQAASEAEALNSIEFFCAISPTAKRAWARCKGLCTTLSDLQWGAFQLSDLCHAWPYMLDKAELRSAFGDPAIEFFRRISLRPGELALDNPEHFFMNNPVWRRPFIELDEHTLFVPLPNLFYSFPFQIFEPFIAGTTRAVEEAYSHARAKFLEDKIESSYLDGHAERQGL